MKLDPMATGVLPVFVGQATRAVSFAENGEKEYVATLRLGLVTDTQDTSGHTLAESPVTVTAAEVAAALHACTGDITQIPPMYSAIKINGQKLYDLARQGREVERKPRPVTIYELELLEQLAEYAASLERVLSDGAGRLRELAQREREIRAAIAQLEEQVASSEEAHEAKLRSAVTEATAQARAA